MTDKHLKTIDNIARADSYYNERLRQARIAFNFALGATAISAIVSFAGIVLLSFGNLPAGGATTAGGATSVAYFLKLAKDANDRLDSAAREK